MSRHNFFRGGTPWPLKRYHADPAGGLRAAVSRMLAEFKIFKRFKVLEINGFFKNSEMNSKPGFLLPENPFFLRETQKDSTYFRKVSELFQKYFKIYKCSILWSQFIHQEKFPSNSILELKKLLKNRKNCDLQAKNHVCPSSECEHGRPACLW